MRLFRTVTIIGVGLIGGSIGLAVKERRIAGEVVGVFRRASTRAKALRRKAVDRGVMSIAEGVRDADLIIIATPVCAIPAMVREAAVGARPGAIITDAGSTKTWIVREAASAVRANPGVRFVGSHPMAGSEHTSVDFARADLFEGAACIVTRTSRADERALRAVVRFWKALGGRVSVMTPERHDARVAMVSHLPHLAAFALAGAVDAPDLRYAAEGFKDTTRVASSDPSLWADIFLTNRRETLCAARLFSGSLRSLIRAVAANDRGSLVRLLAAAKKKRDAFLSGRYG